MTFSYSVKRIMDFVRGEKKITWPLEVTRLERTHFSSFHYILDKL